MGTVRIEPPLPISPKEIPTTAAKIKPAISIFFFLMKAKMYLLFDGYGDKSYKSKNIVTHTAK